MRPTLRARPAPHDPRNDTNDPRNDERGPRRRPRGHRRVRNRPPHRCDRICRGAAAAPAGTGGALGSARRPEILAKLAPRDVEIVAGDLLELGSLTVALAGVQIAYYLVHSMDAAGCFEELDRRAASNFAGAAAKAGVRHIVYLSGLGSGPDLSAHLANRHEVGDILRRSGIVTTELRASIVIGAGSASFETIRAVVERLPAIPAPKWVDTAAQPIAIEDVLAYLLAVLTPEPTRSQVFEIGR
jgi:uncharacterized protein YbjT (DUF2867 family)